MQRIYITVSVKLELSSSKFNSSRKVPFLIVYNSEHFYNPDARLRN